MTNWLHERESQYIQKTSFCTGMQPRAITGDAARATFQNLRCHRQHESYARQWGRVVATLNGNMASDFYVISNAVTPADTSQTTRRVLIEIQLWNITTYPATWQAFTCKWNTVTFASGNVVETDGYSSGPTGPYIQSIQEVDVSSPSNGLTSDLLEIDGAIAENVTISTLPEEYLSTDAAYDLIPGTTNPGQTLRGGDNGSAGTLIHRQDAGDSVLANTRRCLFSQMHGSGYYAIGPTATWTTINLWSTAKNMVKGRNLRDRSAFPNDNCDVAFVATHDGSGGNPVQVTFYSSQTGDSYVHSLTSVVTTPTLYTVPSAFRYDPTGDEITVTVYVNDTNAININAISLWEAAGGEEV